MSDKVRICEVGLRDGLQNEQTEITTEQKTEIFDALISSGLDFLEIASFVHPKLVPQMADAEQMVEHSKKYSDKTLQSLVLNKKGYQRAIEAGSKSIGLVLSCTESFSEKNARMSLEEAEKIVSELAKQAKEDSVRARLYFSVAWVCPYDGKVDQGFVASLIDKVSNLPFSEFVLSDTVGKARPEEVESLLQKVSNIIPVEKIGLHMHDTSGTGLENCEAGLDAGVRILDSSIGGLGGCPFAPGAKGNIATEDLVFMLDEAGFETNVDLNKLRLVTNRLEEILGREIGGRTSAYRKSEKWAQ